MTTSNTGDAPTATTPRNDMAGCNSDMLDIQDELNRLKYLVYAEFIMAAGMRAVADEKASNALSIYFVLLEQQVQTVYDMCCRRTG